jgi:nucleoside-diphosphate-sugar epimerase
MNNVLVTGGAGFIGIHLVKRLLHNGFNVKVVDRLSNGKIEKLPIHNKHLKVYKRSIMENMEDCFTNVDTVFHLAALPRPQLSIMQPKLHHRTNVDGTLNVLIHCRDKGVKRMVFVSSASVYGDQPHLPSRETDIPHPMSPYGIHKLIGEEYCQLFTKIYDLETNSIRPFNVYGTGMEPSAKFSSAIPTFIELIKDGKSPTIWGSGDQKRDYVYVEDLIDLMLLTATSGVYGEVFNCGYEKDISVNDLFRMICKKLHKHIEPIYKPALIEPRGTLSNCRKAHKMLGWKAKVGISEGLDKII